jgi:dimethylamine/trimethylamine dehydrogenase
VLAELLAAAGHDTIYATPASEASTWTRNTLEQAFIQRRLLEKDIAIEPFRSLDALEDGAAVLSCVFTGRPRRIAVDSVVLVTARLPDEVLALDLAARRQDWDAAGIRRVDTIGDALAPATIAHATYAGRRYAEELDEPPLAEGALPFRREIAELLPLD